VHPACPTVSAAAVIVTALLVPGLARAQETAQSQSASLRNFDATGYVAWFRGNRGGIGGDTFRDWYTAGLWGAGVGRYWTEHLKTEAELTGTSRGTLVSFENVQTEPSFSRAIYRSHSYRLRTLSLVQSYQFRHNAWVHPFLGGGLDIDWERQTTDGSVQTVDSRDDQVIVTSDPLLHEAKTRVIARAVVIAGFKAYVARHAFLRTDLRASVTDGLDQVAWRFGFGWDF
jgi:hypothetical protein